MEHTQYILGIDQSTQGTKALVLDETGKILSRADAAHRQIINDKGWVEHDPEEIWENTKKAAALAIEKAGIPKEAIAGIGISNQRETSIAFRKDGTPIYNAIVWQCARAAKLCEGIRKTHPEAEALIEQRTGIRLSPYFPAAKIAWILENVPGARKLAEEGELRYGTMDTYLVYRMTGGKVYRTDRTNASRTQLFDIRKLSWDADLGRIFQVPISNLPEAVDSDGDFGSTTLDGVLPHPVPIRGVLGDSHAALFGQGCLSKGQVKATYGTGSSVMMNIGETPVASRHGVVTSIAFARSGQVAYCLEGNINYTGAVITWLKDDLGLVQSAGETEALARTANPADHTYLVPAFTGLGAPWWSDSARGILTGLSRTTKRAEIVRAALDCIAYQITDVCRAMEEDAGMPIQELRVDGGPTKNRYLMQFQSDIAKLPVLVPPAEELSGMGAAYMAGLALGIYQEEKLFAPAGTTKYLPQMAEAERTEKLAGWRQALSQVLGEERK